MRLTFNVYGAEPYDLDTYSLADASEAEADTVSAQANADHLSDPSDECRDALREKVIADAAHALQRAGDTYTDPLGVRWTLID